MKTLTKTKLTVKTGVGLALIGGVALVAGVSGWRVYKKYNPIVPITPQRVMSGNVAGYNVTDVDKLCTKKMTDYETSVVFFTNNRALSYPNTYPQSDYACFAANQNDAYVGAGSSTDKNLGNSPDNIVGLPAGNDGIHTTTNSANNYCCDIKKYYSADEVANCRALTEDNFGRLQSRFADGTAGNLNALMAPTVPLACAMNGRNIACFHKDLVNKGMVSFCLSSKEECLKQGSGFFACPVGPKSCGFWTQTNHRGRAGFDLCKGRGYDGVCVNKFSGEYLGCLEFGMTTDKCEYIDIYGGNNHSGPMPAGGMACDVNGKDWTTFNPKAQTCEFLIKSTALNFKQAVTACQNKEATSICINKYTGTVVTEGSQDGDGCIDVYSGDEFCLKRDGKNQPTDTNNVSCGIQVKKELSCTDIAKTSPYKAARNKCITLGASETDDNAKPYAICVDKYTGEPVAGGEFGDGSAGCISPYSGSYFCLKQNDQGTATNPNNKVCYYDRFSGKVYDFPVY